MPEHPLSERELEALLDFYQAAGIDRFLEERPVDRFTLPGASEAGHAGPRTAAGGGHVADRVAGEGQGTAPTPIRQADSLSIPATSSRESAVIPDGAAVQSARERARTATNLQELHKALSEFEGCNLRLTAKNLVFADGNPDARIMFVGEAPGREEDTQGKPFVGRSGRLLDLMLAAIGLDRSSAYIANVVPWRPPGNRTPTPQETELCKPFIMRQIELADPELLVFLGAASAKSLLGVQEGIRRLRGRWMEYGLNGRTIACMATYHPAYLLRSPLEKRASWRDFLSLKARLDTLVS